MKEHARAERQRLADSRSAHLLTFEIEVKVSDAATGTSNVGPVAASVKQQDYWACPNFWC